MGSNDATFPSLSPFVVVIHSIISRQIFMANSVCVKMNVFFYYSHPIIAPRLDINLCNDLMN